MYTRSLILCIVWLLDQVFGDIFKVGIHLHHDLIQFLI